MSLSGNVDVAFVAPEVALEVPAVSSGSLEAPLAQ
jgi:hypothetical protein